MPDGYHRKMYWCTTMPVSIPQQPADKVPYRHKQRVTSCSRSSQFFNGKIRRAVLKTTTDAVVVSGEVVYLYKLDKAANPHWFPMFPHYQTVPNAFGVGSWPSCRSRPKWGVYHIDYSRYRDSLLCAVNLMYPDTLALHNANIQGTMLFNLDAKTAGPMTNRISGWTILCPSGTRTGIKLSISRRRHHGFRCPKDGSGKQKREHTCTVQWCRPALSIPIYQTTEPKAENEARIWLHFLSNLHILQRENRHLAPTRTFQPGSTISNNPFSSKRKNEQKRNNHRFTVLAETIKQISRYDNESRFQQQCICHFRVKTKLYPCTSNNSRNWQPNQQFCLPRWQASGTSYQDFLLQAKSILGPFYEIHRPYIHYITRQTGKRQTVQNIEIRMPTYTCMMLPAALR